MKWKLGIGKNQMYALRLKDDNVTTYVDIIVKVAEEFTDICTVGGATRTIMDEGYIPTPVTKEEVKKALDAMQRGKAAVGDEITADLLKVVGQIVL